MTTANSLVYDIALTRQNLRQLELRLKQLQANCIHRFTESTTHRECKKCKFVESIHY
ncbi:hypothetical protein ORD22_08840 [Sporosarcina sp. GW1-11]|uniref:hypothetical protein n=1 Tax=Sporosarcina sp. GW1-11 TaxID=2899126 RepID=UPI00294CCB12|nr:hypothetical protein [Sporosarcina sp. GW1-11]MDV6378351.1 hypothetical protein [Sporosarcina sp. GW1-11]